MTLDNKAVSSFDAGHSMLIPPFNCTSFPYQLVNIRRYDRVGTGTQPRLQIRRTCVVPGYAFLAGTYSEIRPDLHGA